MSDKDDVRLGDRPGLAPFHARSEDEKVLKTLLPRVQALEVWRHKVEGRFPFLRDAVEPVDRLTAANGLIGVPGLEIALGEAFEAVASGHHESAARFFFTRLTHHERSSIFLDEGVVTVYISNDPVYYAQAIEILKKDTEKAEVVFNIVKRLQDERRKVVREVMGKHVCESCERTSETTLVGGRQWLCDHCKWLDKNKDTLPREEDPIDGYRRIYDYVMHTFRDEQRPEQTVSQFVVDVLAAVARGKE